MKSSLKSKVFLGIGLIFLAGALAGFFVGSGVTKEVIEEQSNIEHLKEKIMEILEKELSLRPDQAGIIRGHLKRAGAELKEIEQAGARRVEEVFRKYHDIIAKEVDPEQLVILKELETRRRAGDDLTE